MSPDSFDLHPVLKNVLAAIPDAEDKPITAGLLCEKLHDDEKSVISCVRELIDLGLAVRQMAGAMPVPAWERNSCRCLMLSNAFLQRNIRFSMYLT